MSLALKRTADAIACPLSVSVTLIPERLEGLLPEGYLLSLRAAEHQTLVTFLHSLWTKAALGIQGQRVASFDFYLGLRSLDPSTSAELHWIAFDWTFVAFDICGIVASGLPW